MLIVIPAVSFGVWASARLGITGHDAGLIECLRMSVIFVGLAAVLTAGGVGRLAAEASSEGGRRRATMVATRAMAPAGAALVIIAAIPHGDLPMAPGGWVALAAVGAIVGAGGGAVIGLACAGELPTLQELGVWPPTEWQLPWPFDDEAKDDGAKDDTKHADTAKDVKDAKPP